MKDLRRRLARPQGLAINLAIPLVLAGMMLLAFGNLGKKKDDDAAFPPIPILVLDEDKSVLSRFLAGAGANEETRKHLDIRPVADRAEGLARLRDEAAGLLVLPKGFGDAVLSGKKVEIELVKNPAQSVMPLVAEEGGQVLALYLSIAAKLLGGDGQKLVALTNGKGWDDPVAIAALITTVRERLTGVQDLLLPPLIEVKDEKAEAKRGAGGFDFMSFMFPGMIVMGLFFVGLTQMSDLLTEGEAGTLRRMLVAPVGPGTVLVSKVVAVGLVVLASAALLLAVGVAGFGISWGPPLPLAVATGVLCLAVTGFAAILYSVVRTARQGSAFGSVIVMVMSLLGGAFVPTEMLPAWMQGLSLLTVSHWGNAMMRALSTGGGWDGIATPALVLAILGAGATTIGTALLHRRYVRGRL